MPIKSIELEGLKEKNFTEVEGTPTTKVTVNYHTCLKVDVEVKLIELLERLMMLRRKYVCKNGVVHSDEEVVLWSDVEKEFKIKY